MNNLKDITLVQQAYISDDGLSYRAEGYDAKGGSYMVEWPILDASAENQDEACDWTNYIIKAL